MSITVTQIPVGGYDKNFSYVVANQHDRVAFIVDPSGAFDQVERAVAADSLTVVGILITHTHFDHIDQLERAIERYSAPVYVHEHGTVGLADNVHSLTEGSRLALGDSELHVLHTPGHSADSVCYFIPAADTVDGVPRLISGDTLFVSRCGRTTPADAPTLYASLARLKTLPPETILYPGHDYGPTTTATIAEELRTNPYLLAPDLDTFLARRLS